MRYAALLCILLAPAASAGGQSDAAALDCTTADALSVQGEARQLRPGADGRIEVLQIRAVLTPDGAELHRKHPLEWKRRTRPQSIALLDGSLCLRIRFADDAVMEVPFDAYVEGDTADGAKLFGGFTLEIPISDDRQVAKVEIGRTGQDPVVTWRDADLPDRN